MTARYRNTILQAEYDTELREARTGERLRCKRILSFAAPRGQRDLAIELLDAPMTADQVIGILQAAPAIAERIISAGDAAFWTRHPPRNRPA